MNLIFNRGAFEHPADGWYQLEAKGEHANERAGIVQVIDAGAINSMARAFNSEAQAGKLRHGTMMLIDHEHFSDNPDKETIAYGWLQECQARGDGLYGRVRWTNTGRKAVDGGDYRFFSTEYDPAGTEKVTNRGANYIRPLRLAGLTLTNMHNNLGQKGITNRAGALSDADQDERILNRTLSEMPMPHLIGARMSYFKNLKAIKRT